MNLPAFAGSALKALFWLSATTWSMAFEHRQAREREKKKRVCVQGCALCILQDCSGLIAGCVRVPKTGPENGSRKRTRTDATSLWIVQHLPEASGH